MLSKTPLNYSQCTKEEKIRPNLYCCTHSTKVFNGFDKMKLLLPRVSFIGFTPTCNMHPRCH